MKKRLFISLLIIVLIVVLVLIAYYKFKVKRFSFEGVIVSRNEINEKSYNIVVEVTEGIGIITKGMRVSVEIPEGNNKYFETDQIVRVRRRVLRSRAPMSQGNPVGLYKDSIHSVRVISE